MKIHPFRRGGGDNGEPSLDATRSKSEFLVLDGVGIAPQIIGMSHDLYHNRVLELSMLVPPSKGRGLEARVTKTSLLCGSVVTIAVALDAAGEIVTDFDIDAKACALGQATAGVLASEVIGASVNEIRAALTALEEMLKHDGPKPEGRFWELRHLQGVADYPPRHASTLLAFRAMVAAIDLALAARLQSQEK